MQLDQCLFCNILSCLLVSEYATFNVTCYLILRNSSYITLFLIYSATHFVTVITVHNYVCDVCNILLKDSGNY